MTCIQLIHIVHISYTHTTSNSTNTTSSDSIYTALKTLIYNILKTPTTTSTTKPIKRGSSTTSNTTVVNKMFDECKRLVSSTIEMLLKAEEGNEWLLAYFNFNNNTTATTNNNNNSNNNNNNTTTSGNSGIRMTAADVCVGSIMLLSILAEVRVTINRYPHHMYVYMYFVACYYLNATHTRTHICASYLYTITHILYPKQLIPNTLHIYTVY